MPENATISPQEVESTLPATEHPWNWLDPDSPDAEKIVIDTLAQSQVPLEAGQVDSLASYFDSKMFDSEKGPLDLSQLPPDMLKILQPINFEERIIEGKKAWVMQLDLEGLPAYIQFDEPEDTDKYLYSSIGKKAEPSFDVSKLVVETKHGLIDFIQRVPSKTSVKAISLPNPKKKDFYFSPGKDSSKLAMSSLQSIRDLYSFMHEAGHAQFNSVADPELEHEITDALFMRRTFLREQASGKNIPDPSIGEPQTDMRELMSATSLVTLSEHFASAWALNDVTQLFDLQPEEVQKVKSDYEKGFQSYDQLPFVAGTASEAATAIPEQHRAAVLEHCLWYQEQLQDLQYAGISLSREEEFSAELSSGRVKVGWKDGTLQITFQNGENVFITSMFSFATALIFASDVKEKVDFQVYLTDLDEVRKGAPVLIEEEYQQAREILTGALTEFLHQREVAASAKIVELNSIVASLGIDIKMIDPMSEFIKLVDLPPLERIIKNALIGVEVDKLINIDANYPVVRLSKIIYKLSVALAVRFKMKDELFANFHPMTGKPIIGDTERLLFMIEMISEDHAANSDLINALSRLKQVVSEA
jgi:hypothetical protein